MTRCSGVHPISAGLVPLITVVLEHGMRPLSHPGKLKPLAQPTLLHLPSPSGLMNFSWIGLSPSLVCCCGWRQCCWCLFLCPLRAFHLTAYKKSVAQIWINQGTLIYCWSFFFLKLSGFSSRKWAKIAYRSVIEIRATAYSDPLSDNLY